MPPKSPTIRPAHARPHPAGAPSAEYHLGYDAANELLTAKVTAATTTYTYDATGNRTEKESPGATTTYTWDPSDRLLTANDSTAGRFTFTYNAAGQRVRRETPSEDRKFVYDRKKPLLETTAAGLTTLTYEYSQRDEYGDLLTRRDYADAAKYYQNDAIGSTKMLLDAGAAETDSYIYRAFGKVESQSGSTDNRQTYIGKFGYYSEEDLGIYFLNARYYDLETGQFLSADPIGLGVEGSTLWPDRYVYVGANPVSLIDPSGLWVSAVAKYIFANCVAGAMVGIGLDVAYQIIDNILNGVPMAWGSNKCAALAGCVAGLCMGPPSPLWFIMASPCGLIGDAVCDWCVGKVGCKAIWFCQFV